MKFADQPQPSESPDVISCDRSSVPSLAAIPHSAARLRRVALTQGIGDLSPREPCSLRTVDPELHLGRVRGRRADKPDEPRQCAQGVVWACGQMLLPSLDRAVADLGQADLLVFVQEPDRRPAAGSHRTEHRALAQTGDPASHLIGA